MYRGSNISWLCCISVFARRVVDCRALQSLLSEPQDDVDDGHKKHKFLRFVWSDTWGIFFLFYWCFKPSFVYTQIFFHWKRCKLHKHSLSQLNIWKMLLANTGANTMTTETEIQPRNNVSVVIQSVSYYIIITITNIISILKIHLYMTF